MMESFEIFYLEINIFILSWVEPWLGRGLQIICKNEVRMSLNHA